MASSATHSKCSKKAFFIMIQCCIIQKNTCFKLLFQNYMLTVRKSQTKVVPLLSTLLLFLALLLLMPIHSAAHEPSPVSLLYLYMDDIRSEATTSALTLGRASMAITRVNSPFPDILSRPAATLDELTFSLPGIWVSNRENAALGERMVIRGTGWRSQLDRKSVV